MKHSSRLADFATLLIQKGSSVSGSAIINATYQRDLPLLQTLLRNGGNVDARDVGGRTPLMLAARFDDRETIEVLLECGADIHAMDSGGHSAIQWAFASESFAIVAKLSALGATLSENVETFAEPKKEINLTGGIYRAEERIHLSISGIRVRSKSELVIADTLTHLQIPFQYEAPYIGVRTGGFKLPDFSFVTQGSDTLLWEHLGLLSDAGYKSRWDAKHNWYQRNNLVDGENLFVTMDNAMGGLHSQSVLETAKKIQDRLRHNDRSR